MAVKNDPLNIAISGYEKWLHYVKNNRFDIWIDHHDRLMYDPVIADSLYNEAVKILKPEAIAFKNMKQEIISRILNIIQSNSTNASGLYLSALLNATELTEMGGIFNHWILGYRLMEGKNLIVRKNSKIAIIGDYCEGNILNFGCVYDSISSTKGMQINFGTAFIMSFVNSGIQINFNERNYMIGNKGIQIDLGDIFYQEAYINGEHYSKKDFGDKKHVLGALEDKINEIKRLKNLKNDEDKAIIEIKAIDWKKFKQDILSFTNQN